MVDRLSALDASFLHLETAATPMHVGSVAVFEPPTGPDGRPAFDYQRLVRLIGERIALVPRFRQKVRQVPGHLGHPVWVDDPDFDLTFHVRRSALPRPGGDAELRELAGRLMARRLDRSRPLWEVYLVEGLAGDPVGVLTKTHEAMVDGVAAVDIATVLFDATPTPGDVPRDDWQPSPGPGRIGLLADALVDVARRPTEVLDVARTAVGDVRTTASRAGGAVGGVLASVRSAVRPPAPSPLRAGPGEQRRIGTASTSLEDHRRVRAHHGGTVNDVVLATVAGGLRRWLLERGLDLSPGTSVRAVVPLSVRDGEPGGPPGNRVSSYLVDLPVGVADPVQRLLSVTSALQPHAAAGAAVGAAALVGLAGFAPPTLHALGARVAAGLSRRTVDLVVTNVPGPQVPLYAAGARMLEMYPLVPLTRGRSLAVALTSYDGAVSYGLTADRDAVPDVDRLARHLEESLAELVGTVPA